MREKSFFKKEEKKSNSKLMKTEMKQILRCVSLSQYAAFLSVFPNSNILSSFNSSKYSFKY